jgi:hypothetical protein
MSKVRKLIAALVVAVALTIPATASAAPTYQGGCVQTSAQWHEYKVTETVYYASWVYWRIHDGGYYGNWHFMNRIYGSVWERGWMGEDFPNHTLEIQYAVGNGGGWAYGHVAWLNPYTSSGVCG